MDKKQKRIYFLTWGFFGLFILQQLIATVYIIILFVGIIKSISDDEKLNETETGYKILNFLADSSSPVAIVSYVIFAIMFIIGIVTLVFLYHDDFQSIQMQKIKKLWPFMYALLALSIASHNIPYLNYVSTLGLLGIFVLGGIIIHNFRMINKIKIVNDLNINSSYPNINLDIEDIDIETKDKIE
ncbi:hypothetical protein ACXYRP_00140 [Mycoplasma sp. 5912]